MSRQDSTLSTYLKRVMALKEERRRTPSEEELRSIAREIGLSDEDLAAIDQAAEDHAVRGQGFLEHRRYGDAIDELAEAVGVAPRRVEWLHSLARAYLGRWQAGGEPSDRERAEALARECLEIEPHHSASYEVLNELDATPEAPATARRSATLLSLFALAMLLTVVIGLMVLWRSTEKAVAPAPVPETAKAPEAVGTEINEATAKELDVPITLDPGATGVVVGLEARLSRLVSYGSGQSFYTLNAILTNRGNSELDKLSGRLELLDADGAVVDQDGFEVLNKTAPILRPGDSHALHQLKETSGSARSARLVIETVEQNPAASAYAEAEPLDLEWRAERVSDFEIAVRQRSVRFSENALSKDGSGYFNAVIEVENTGQRTIRALKLEAEIAGPGGAWTVPDSNHVVTSSGPSLRPGEIRLERFIEKVEARPEGYRLLVVSVQ